MITITDASILAETRADHPGEAVAVVLAAEGVRLLYPPGRDRPLRLPLTLPPMPEWRDGQLVGLPEDARAGEAR